MVWSLSIRFDSVSVRSQVNGFPGNTASCLSQYRRALKHTDGANDESAARPVQLSAMDTSKGTIGI